MTASLYEERPSGVTPPLPRWRDRLLHLLLPAACFGCGEPLPATGAALGLCGACRTLLQPVPEGACAICGHRGRPGDPPGGSCAACREHPPAFDRLLALWSYEDPLPAVVQALKFRRLDYLGRHLGEALVDRWESELAGFDAVVPVPLHWRRRLLRGYNQAERIARPLARRLDLPLTPVLRRVRATPPQTSMGRAGRLANLCDAFRARRGARVHSLHLLLVDDVATTGATLDAAAAVLRRAGAAAVTALVAGRTPAGR